MPIVEPSSPEDSDESDAIANDDSNPTSSAHKEKQKVSIKTEKADDSGVRPQLRRQRSESSASTGNGRRKIQRISTAEAFAHLEDSIQRAVKEVTDTTIQIASQLERAAPTPSIDPVLAAAISAIEENEGLSDEEYIDVVDAIVHDPSIGAMYLAMSRPNVRTIFLRNQLNQCRER